MRYRNFKSLLNLIPDKTTIVVDKKELIKSRGSDGVMEQKIRVKLLPPINAMLCNGR